VLDLGAAPGSWSLYSAERVGAGGRIVAIDVQEIKQAFPPNVRVVRGDAFDIARQGAAASSPAPAESGASASEVVSVEAPYDVVLSDMAPSTSGSKISDQARSFDLFMKALDVASAFGKAGSHFVGKIFMSDDFPKAKNRVAAEYATVRVIRPEGTRSGSSEIFVVGMGMRTKAAGV
jgi:23S rRNA (uridine2552-2'-O)-methyltransferase